MFFIKLFEFLFGVYKSNHWNHLVGLLSERASSCDAGKTTGWLAQDHVAASAQDDGLSVAENGRDFNTALKNKIVI